MHGGGGDGDGIEGWSLRSSLDAERLVPRLESSAGGGTLIGEARVPGTSSTHSFTFSGRVICLHNQGELVTMFRYVFTKILQWTDPAVSRD